MTRAASSVRTSEAGATADTVDVAPGTPWLRTSPVSGPDPWSGAGPSGGLVGVLDGPGPARNLLLAPPCLGRDAPSVGELLLEADLGARRLLADADQLDVAELTTAWPSLLQAAEELVGLLPRRDGPPWALAPSTALDPSLGRLRAVTDRLDRLRRSTPWLASSPPSARLLTVGSHLRRARDLLHRHHGTRSLPALDPPGDGAAVRTRVMHTLWLSAHAVVLAARRAGRERSEGAGECPASGDGAVAVLTAVQGLAESLEQLAAEDVRRTFPTILRGRRRRPPAPSPLRASVAVWEAEAGRTLVGGPSAADRDEVVRVQAVILATSRAVLDVAARQGAIEQAGYRELLAPHLVEAEDRVGALRQMVHDLATRGAGCLDRCLARAGSEVVSAHTRLVAEGTEAAPGGLTSRRVDLGALSRDALSALPASVSVLTRLGTSLAEPGFTTHAVGLQRLINRLERLKGLRHESPCTPWIDPRDLALGRTVTPPDWVRAELDAAVTDATRAVSAAITATAQVGAHRLPRG